ncbi:hypothetical protein ACS0TY_012939 [Phlomoides rotata]
MQQQGQHIVRLDTPVWKRIWDLDVIPKIKLFMWRLLHEIIPTSLNLTCRFVDVDPMCVRCGSDIESVEHALRDCAWVRDIWEASPFASSISNASLHVWVDDLLASCSVDKQCLLATTLWFLWWERNNVVFSKKSLSKTALLEKIAVHRSQFLEAKSKNGRSSASSKGGVVKWRLPSTGRWKLNCDASFKRGLGSTIAGVLWDDEGSVVWCFAEKCGDISDVSVAEALAVQRGIEVALQRGVLDLVVESDAQLVIKALTCRKLDLSYFGRVIETIGDKVGMLRSVSFSWTRRGANVVAHKLALFAHSCDSPFFALDVPAQFFADVQADLSSA